MRVGVRRTVHFAQRIEQPWTFFIFREVTFQETGLLGTFSKTLRAQRNGGIFSKGWQLAISKGWEKFLEPRMDRNPVVLFPYNSTRDRYSST